MIYDNILDITIFDLPTIFFFRFEQYKSCTKGYII